MKVTERSVKADRFYAVNDDLPRISETGVRISIIEFDKRLCVFLEVGEDTKHNDLRNDDTIQLAREWRDRLVEWQGPWQSGGFTHGLEKLCRMQKHGSSYSELAAMINEKVAKSLQEFSEYENEFKLAKPELETIGYLFLRNSTIGGNYFGFEHAQGLLEMIRLDSVEIDEILNLGLENIRDGNKPFRDIKEYPVDRRKLERTLRTWREGEKHRILCEKEENDQIIRGR